MVTLIVLQIVFAFISALDLLLGRFYYWRTRKLEKKFGKTPHRVEVYGIDKYFKYAGYFLFIVSQSCMLFYTVFWCLLVVNGRYTAQWLYISQVGLQAALASSQICRGLFLHRLHRSLVQWPAFYQSLRVTQWPAVVYICALASLAATCVPPTTWSTVRGRLVTIFTVSSEAVCWIIFILFLWKYISSKVKSFADKRDRFVELLPLLTLWTLRLFICITTAALGGFRSPTVHKRSDIVVVIFQQLNLFACVCFVNQLCTWEGYKRFRSACEAQRSRRPSEELYIPVTSRDGSCAKDNPESCTLPEQRTVPSPVERSTESLDVKERDRALLFRSHLCSHLGAKVSRDASDDSSDDEETLLIPSSIVGGLTSFRRLQRDVGRIRVEIVGIERKPVPGGQQWWYCIEPESRTVCGEDDDDEDENLCAWYGARTFFTLPTSRYITYSRKWKRCGSVPREWREDLWAQIGEFWLAVANNNDHVKWDLRRHLFINHSENSTSPVCPYTGSKCSCLHV